jgi:hypothetical protein
MMAREEFLSMKAAELEVLPVRSCKLCGHLELRRGFCRHYERKLPWPERECRCVEFKPWR